VSRFALYWPSLHDYILAGAEDLASRGHEVSVVSLNATISSPARNVAFSRFTDWSTTAFRPDVEVFCGWHVPEITQLLRVSRERASLRLLYFDTQWSGRLRQIVRLPAARMRLRRQFDGCFVPGSRQVEFAERLGFDSSRILSGALTFQSALLHSVPLIDANGSDARRQFLFVGRPVREKGFDLLLSGYEMYHAEASSPWPLVIAGNAVARTTGPERYIGFVNHVRLAEEMARSSCLVLPSRFEPYGAVVLEAAAAGLLLLVTAQVGAQTDLVHAGRNGFVIEPVQSSGVAAALHRVAALSPDELAAASSASRQAADAFTPAAWADSMEQALRWSGSR
jgi:glycosyltransferase involved in cell wall biosynthesis